MTLKKKTLKQLAESASLPVHPSDAGVQIPDAFVSKQPSTKTEGSSSDLPTHSSDAAAQIPDSLSGIGAKAVKPELNGQAIADASGKHGAKEGSFIPEEDDKKDEDKAEIKEGTPPWLKDKEEGKDEDKDSDDSKKKEVAEAEEKAEKEEKEEIQEHLAALVRGEILPDAFKEKAATLFENALKSCVDRRLEVEKKKLEEKYSVQLKKEVSQLSESLEDRADSYLDHITDVWLDENELAIESSLKSNIVEGFISGLRSLFETHNVTIPENQVNLLEKQIEKTEKLEQSLNEEIQRGIELKKKLANVEKEAVFTKLTEGLTDVDAAKFKKLCSNVLYEDATQFDAKLKVIKESYFPKTTAVHSNPVSTEDAVLLDGGLISEDKKDVVVAEPHVAAAANELSRFFKNEK